MPRLGAFTFAFGQPYQRMAAAQALSWAARDIPMTVVIDRPPVRELATSGAHIVQVDRQIRMLFEFERWAYELSPYQVTIKTDCDLIVPGGWSGPPEWALDQPCVVSGTPHTLQGLMVPSSPYRNRWSELGVPEVHSAIFLFHKCELGAAFFAEVGAKFDKFYTSRTSELDAHPSTDLIYSLAWTKVCGPEVGLGLPFIHMKFGMTGTKLPDNWTTAAQIIQEGNQLYINGMEVTWPLHYYDKRFLGQVNLVSKGFTA